MVAELCGGPEKVVRGFLGEKSALGSFNSAAEFSTIPQGELREAEWKMGRQ